MILITWTNMFSVGIEEIDEQHKTLIGLINQLNHAIKSHHENEVLNSIVNEVFDYTHYHFDHESNMMRTMGYSETEAHVREHDQFIKTLHEFRENFNNGHLEITPEFLTFLKNWLTHHIMVVDKKMGNSIRKHNESL